MKQKHSILPDRVVPVSGDHGRGGRSDPAELGAGNEGEIGIAGGEHGQCLRHILAAQALAFRQTNIEPVQNLLCRAAIRGQVGIGERQSLHIAGAQSVQWRQVCGVGSNQDQPAHGIGGQRIRIGQSIRDKPGRSLGIGGEKDIIGRALPDLGIEGARGAGGDADCVAGLGLERRSQILGRTGEVRGHGDEGLLCGRRGRSRQAKAGGEAEGRDMSNYRVMAAAPAHTGPIEEGIEKTKWFPAMVGNHVADIVEKYGTDGDHVPTSLTDYIKNRKGYDYSKHGQSDNPYLDFITEDIVKSFCVLGTPDEHIAKIRDLADAGTTQFNIYLDSGDEEKIIADYGEKIIPAFR